MKNEGTRSSINFVGTEVQTLTYPEFFTHVDQWVSNKNKRSHHIAIINAYCATEAMQNKKVAKIYSKADLIGPDGMPFVYWLRWVLKKPCDQFDASSILTNLAQKSEQTGYNFFLYGGHEDVVKKMKERLELLFPHIKIAGYYSPPFRELTKEEDNAICEEINSLKPDIVCVGLGTPKQDYWIDEHIYKIKGAVFIPCGAIFDFFGGRIKRAPRIISRFGVEWLYRLFSKDIKRLWYRYTIINVIFLWNFFLQNLGIRSFGSCRVIRPINENR
jgi:N-acetylglucosaminyldiphosphoundecaprenol N-acetyl-beta-D-mannosaminyltransferase